MSGTRPARNAASTGLDAASGASAIPTGRVHGLEGNYVVGVLRGAGQVPCRIRIADGSGRIIADAPVPHHAATEAEPAKDELGFRIPLAMLPPRAVLHVYANRVELQNSPVKLGAGLYDGQIWAAKGAVAGWVTERKTRFAAPEITIRDQHGRELLRCASILDDISPDPHFAPARFTGDLAQQCFGRGELRLTAFANGVRFAEALCDLPLTGVFEEISAERCVGWLLSPAAPHRPLTFDIVRNGTALASVTCDVTRPDVAEIFPGAETPGFSRTLAAIPDADTGAVTLSLRLAGSGLELFDGPYSLASRPALIAASHVLARQSLLGPFTAAERAVLEAALEDFRRTARQSEQLTFSRQRCLHEEPAPTPEARDRLNIIIPVFGDVETTRICIDSVLACRASEADWVILINDRSPEPGMATLLAGYGGIANVHLLHNEENIGFIRTVNRGLGYCTGGDVLLLNSDTRLFAGGLQELQRVARALPDVGTVTALSNSATIFSYPHAELTRDHLDDIDWPDLAATALAENAGRTIDVPTGHGFCLYIRRDVLARLPRLDESFGRGYGEENDFCAKAADLGYRNVASAGTFVAHRGSRSFNQEKTDLVAKNLQLLHARYPEYAAQIMQAQRQDVLRSARWALDSARLRRASAAGRQFALLLHHRMGGGADRAIEAIEHSVGYGETTKLLLACRADGWLELTCDSPLIRATFTPEEGAALIDVLAGADISLVVAHQVLGFAPGVIAGLTGWLGSKHAIFHIHDYYCLCPRVTMIDAVRQFCDIAPPDTCSRCIALGGRHEAARRFDVPATQHRPFFAAFLHAFTHVVAPSEAAAGYFRRAFPDLDVEVTPHPELSTGFPPQARRGSDAEIVLFGAVGVHKGAAKLVEIAGLARLTRPHLRFLVIGFTDRDGELRNIGNVDIIGRYVPQRLPELAMRARGRLALFLSCFPETYSYTLTEAVRLGFIPLVPDIGALAERVRGAGFGAVFRFPIIASDVLDLIDRIASNEVPLWTKGASPASFAPKAAAIRQTRALYRAGL